MKTILISTFEKLHKYVESKSSVSTVFRGVKNAEYELIPKIGRYKQFRSNEDINIQEKYMLSLFKQYSIPHLDYRPLNDWEWLAIAQHFGLATRLLDWTRNILVAAYFAVRSEFDGDSSIYCFQHNRKLNVDKYPNPFEYSTVNKFVPNHITNRIIAQAGLFTIHPKPQDSFESDKVEKLIIKNNYRKKLKNILYKYNIHEFSMFPNLDGLSKHIIWLRTNTY